MNLNELNKFYQNDILHILSQESKIIFLLGDFNINLLNYDQETSKNEFLHYLSLHLFLPYTLQAIRVRRNSKTLINNIFSMQYPSICYLVISDQVA